MSLFGLSIAGRFGEPDGWEASFLGHCMFCVIPWCCRLTVLRFQVTRHRQHRRTGLLILV